MTIFESRFIIDGILEDNDIEYHVEPEINKVGDTIYFYSSSGHLGIMGEKDGGFIGSVLSLGRYLNAKKEGFTESNMEDVPMWRICPTPHNFAEYFLK